MNWNLVLELFSVLPKVVGIVQTAPTQGSAVSQLRAILSSPLVVQLETMAASIFPQLAPELHILAMLTAADVNTVKLIQEAINIIAPPKPPLVADGLLGPKTRAAIMAFQAKHGLPSTGFVADAEWSVIQSVIAKL